MRRYKNRRHRKATAVAELAVCLPAVVLLVMGAIECCSMIFLRQALQATAYEGIRVAIKSDSTGAAVLARCNRVLTERDVTDAVVNLNPASPELVTRGTAIRVSVTAPCNANNFIPLQFFAGSNLIGSATMIKE